MSEKIREQLKEKAINTNERVNKFREDQISILRNISIDPIIIKFDDKHNLTKRLIEYRNQNHTFLNFSLYSPEGIKIVDTSGLGIGEKVDENKLWAKRIFGDEKNKSSMGDDFYFDEKLGKRVLIFAIKIIDPGGRFLGVLRGNITSSILHQIVNAKELFLKNNIYVNVLLGESIIYSNHLKTDPHSESYFFTSKEILSIEDEHFAYTEENTDYSTFYINFWKLSFKYPKKLALHGLEELKEKSIYIGSGILTFSLILIYFLSRSITSPLARLEKAAHLLGEGNLESRVQYSSGDEIGSLANSFNLMANRLQDSLSELEQKNSELLRLDKLKDEFLSNTSHELRTPLNGIIGITESLLDTQKESYSDHLRYNLSLIFQSGKRLSTLVNDILDFSKLKNHDLVLKQKPVNINAIVNMTFEVLKPLIRNKEIELKNNIPPDIYAFGDEDRIVQIFTNLIGNASKFTNSGMIEAGFKTKDAKYEFFIRDTGIGIPEDKIKDIFNSFEQVDASISREYGGTGIGLSITKNLVELHGGTIFAKSEIGKGTTLFFDLPISEEIPEKEESNLKFNQNRYIEPEQPVLLSEEPVRDYLENLNILIVDDEPINLQVLENILSVANYSVIKANNGNEAIQLVKTNDIDLILLDIMMPHKSGYDVCKELRDTFRAGELPIIMLTAKSQVVDLVHGFECGANDYLPKPFQKEELISRIRTHLELSKMTQSYSRFVPHEYLSILSKESILDIKLGDNVATNMSVVFSDIRDFSTLSETMTPQENFNFVNAYFRRVSPKIREYGGIIVKYVGDAIMAVFKNGSDFAVDSCLSQLATLKEYNSKRVTNNYKPIRIGFGIHSGFMTLGMIGEAHRMQGDAFSDQVNLTARLEGLTKYYGVSLIVSDKVLGELTHPEKYHSRFLDKVRVKGRKTPIEIYEIFNEDELEIRDKKIKFAPLFSQSIEFYKNRDFNNSRKSFHEYLKAFPGDLTTLLYLERLKELIEKGVDTDWDGVYEFTKK
ncbi:MAG: response regulator [Leptospiraceae bacterium]|nr:response regulator [Leptospiraceae bacterium]